jgi:hypothetical protein
MLEFFVALMGLLAIGSLFAMILSHDIDPSRWFRATSSESILLRSILKYRLEQISQDPEWIQRIEQEGPSPLYQHLVSEMQSSTRLWNTSYSETHDMVYRAVKQSGLISKKFLK